MRIDVRFSVLVGTGLLLFPGGAAAQTVRPAVGIPLQQAQALIARHDYAAALREIHAANAAGHLTSYETVVVAEIQGEEAAGAGDEIGAAKAYQTVLDAGIEPQATQLELTQAIAGFYYQAGDDAQAVTWIDRYIAAGGTDPRTRELLAQSYYRRGDYTQAAQAAWREQERAREAGEAVPEGSLQLLASAAQKSGDTAQYWSALKTLLSDYPSQAYWAQALGLVASSPEFSDSLTLEIYRLRLATGTLSAAGDYEDYAERAILAGEPAEAQRVINDGFASGILNDATDSGHALRLKVLAAKETAADAANLASRAQQAKADPDPKNLIDTGTDFVAQGQPAQGVELIQAGIGRGGINNPVAAALALGRAELTAGAKNAAISSFQSVPGYAALPNQALDPAAALAQLWVIFAQGNAKT